MAANFFDRQDTGNAANGTSLARGSELRELLDGVQHREPFFAELIGDNGFTLLLGIGATFGCAQLSPSDGSLPCLMVVTPLSDASERAFLIGGTPSPVPRRYILSRETLLEVAAAFLERGERHAGLRWEDVPAHGSQLARSRFLVEHPYTRVEFEWLAIDEDGHVLLFSTAGRGPVPETAIEDADSLEGVRGRSRTGREDLQPSDWVDAAARGLFASDWSHDSRSYELVAAPTRPISVEHLAAVSPTISSQQL
jgi:hypothetical protein